MAEYRARCPKCGYLMGDEVMRRFTLTHEGDGAARGKVRIWWICTGCGHEWDDVSARSWTDTHGTAARHPGVLRARVERYAQRLYNRTFDFPPGSYRGRDVEFELLAERFRSTLGRRFSSSISTPVAERLVARAASKLMARWEPPVNFKYPCRARRKASVHRGD